MTTADTIDISKLHLRNVRSETLLSQRTLNALDITIVGCGAVGSQVARMLSAMGCSSMLFYDHDVVSHENLGPQQWPYTDAINATPKVDALANLCLALNPTVKFTPVRDKFTADTPTTTPVVFSCTDSMDARRAIAQSFSKQWVDNANTVTSQLGLSASDMSPQPILIDTRMGALALQIYTATPSSIDAYFDTIFPQSEALQVPCTERSTAHCASACAALAVNALFSHLRGNLPPRFYSLDLFNHLISLKDPNTP